jgi:hypothetical protein
MKIKVLNFDGVPDSSGDIFDPEGISFNYEVPVFVGEGTYPTESPPLCYAVLDLEPDGLYATFNGEAFRGLEPLIPYVARKCLDKEVDPRGATITKCEIVGVGLAHGPNQDRRIPSPGYQLEEQARGL